MFLVVGSTTVDLFVSGVKRLPGWGGEEFAVSNLAFTDAPLRLSLGGNGANAAFALGRLGANVRLLSAVGDDALGNIICNWLEGAGVKTAGLRRRDQQTATTVLVVDGERNRLIFHHAGAYPAVTAADLPQGWATPAEGLQVLLINGYTLMQGLRPAGYIDMLQQAHAAGAHTAVDIGPAIGQVARLEEITPILPWVDTLIANGHELSVCVDAPDVPSQVAALHAGGARRVMIKQGEEGATLYDGGAPLHVPAFPVAASQTVGAGDTFNAGLLWGIAQGWDDASAMRYGAAMAALVVRSSCGILDAPRRDDVTRLLTHYAAAPVG
jgi:sugar/nucleoside kinase (ribokinase family)